MIHMVSLLKRRNRSRDSDAFASVRVLHVFRSIILLASADRQLSNHAAAAASSFSFQSLSFISFPTEPVDTVSLAF